MGSHLRRIVIKIGTSIVSDGTGRADEHTITHYTEECKRLMQNGYAPLLVASGAVRVGGSIIASANNRKSLAAAGQAHLVARWMRAAGNAGFTLAQILCSRPDVARRGLFSAFEDTLEALLEKKAVPLVNENDALTNGEPEAFGNNDILAALVAVASRAEYLILLTDQKGFYTADPRVSAKAELVREVGDVTRELFEYCSAGSSPHGIGGMITKLKAARMATAGGVETIIANGLGKPKVRDVLSGVVAGTKFLARRNRTDLTGRARWMLATRSSAGVLVVDGGAVEAIKRGKTLLAVGVTAIRGDFQMGDIVEILDESKHEIGCGVTHIFSQTLRKRLADQNKKNLDVIHCDHLITY